MNPIRTALVGQPNAGKSTLFNVLSDIKADASNFSGTTVEVFSSRMEFSGRQFHLTDLPGLYSLNPGDEAEKVTCRHLLSGQTDLVINVVNASFLSRSLELTVELMELGLPMIIALNQQDEADRKGLNIDTDKLSEILGLPVVPTVALYGRGVTRLLETAIDMLKNKTSPRVLTYSGHIERLLQSAERKIVNENPDPELVGTPRYYAIKAMENPDRIPADLKSLIEPELIEMERLSHQEHFQDTFETISQERHHLAMKLSEAISHFVRQPAVPVRELLDQFLLHPYFGHFLMGLYFLFFFSVVFAAGRYLSAWLEIPLDHVAELILPLQDKHPLLWLSLDGLYQGLAGGIGIVLPYFLPLLLLTAVSEDTGYLSRISFLLDAFMHRIGLHGKSTAAFILGFGCSVPAIYATRILESRRDRILTGLLIPFIPCSARIAVIFALSAAFLGPFRAMGIFLLILVLVALVGKALSSVMGKPLGLIMEIPDLKPPSPAMALKKTWYRCRDFFKYVMPFLLLGSLAMSWMQQLQLDRVVSRLSAPLLNFLLGLPEALGSTLVFGFFRKELILIMAGQALGAPTLAELPLNPNQVAVFIVFVALYFPCFATLVVMWREFGYRLALISAGLSLLVATFAASLLSHLLRLLP